MARRIFTTNEITQGLINILSTIRVRQWLKNLAIFSPILFTGQLFNIRFFQATCLGFTALCLLSSSSYIINDILDKQKDQKHPLKKSRPIADGRLSLQTALVFSFFCVAGGLFISSYISTAFFFLALAFILLQYLYSIVLKHFSIIDILTITTGYVLRVYAGEAATGFHISIWLALAALSLALFLAIGKRRAELTLIQSYSGIVPRETRSSLTHYSEKLLDTYTAMFANSTFITYAFYTFLERPVRHGFLFSQYSGYISGFQTRKWMMVTIPFVLFGIMRYMMLIYEGKGESPEKILTSDKPLLTTIIMWVITVFVVVYGIGG